MKLFNSNFRKLKTRYELHNIIYILLVHPPNSYCDATGLFSFIGLLPRVVFYPEVSVLSNLCFNTYLKNQFLSQVANAEILNCEKCKKKYKTKRGLTRHMKAKHRESDENKTDCSSPKIPPLEVKQMLMDATQKLSADKCFPETYRFKFKSFATSIQECIEIRNKFSNVIDGFTGNAEKFYSASYQLLYGGCVKTIGNLEEQEATILLTEFLNFCLAKLSGMVNDFANITPPNSNKQLSDKEIHALEYLTGYCFRNTYWKIRNSKASKSDACQQILSILKAAKTESAQPLVDMKNRGGLWKVGSPAISLFKRVESIFSHSSQKNRQIINAEDILNATLKDPICRSNISVLIANAEMEIEKEVGKSVFEHLILLYVRVRCHSFAKDLKEKHKVAKKSSQKKSLRKEIKKASTSTDLGH